MKATKRTPIALLPPKAQQSVTFWKRITILLLLTLLPWASYLTFLRITSPCKDKSSVPDTSVSDTSLIKSITSGFGLDFSKQYSLYLSNPLKSKNSVTEKLKKMPPVMGPIPHNGSKPILSAQHRSDQDAIFALACNYGLNEYRVFVGSVRKFGFTGDIVLAVNPLNRMGPDVKKYLDKSQVVAYGFEVQCKGNDNCKFSDEFLGLPDPRPFRTFANIRYAMYEYWLRFYEDKSYILILDFRDTFFQANPFGHLPYPPSTREAAKYELNLFQENFKVKNIGRCVFNSLWVGRCFGKEALAKVKDFPVLCSGSTMGSYSGIHHYIRTMLESMDTVQCFRKGIESDQGYQNYLYYNGYFTSPDGKVNATVFAQGEGVVNTIGALNGFRVPAAMKGPLDTHWKIRSADGFIRNNNGNISACVHQWDRWQDELHSFVYSKIIGDHDRLDNYLVFNLYDLNDTEISNMRSATVFEVN